MGGQAEISTEPARLLEGREQLVERRSRDERLAAKFSVTVVTQGPRIDQPLVAPAPGPPSMGGDPGVVGDGVQAERLLVRPERVERAEDVEASPIHRPQA